jgi:hypothetical protein
MAGVVLAARVAVMSATLRLAKPTLATKAKAKVRDQRSQERVARNNSRRDQSETAWRGRIRAALSTASPMARNSQPAKSVAPKDRANHALMERPTPARAMAMSVRAKPVKSKRRPEGNVGLLDR